MVRRIALAMAFAFFPPFLAAVALPRLPAPEAGIGAFALLVIWGSTVPMLLKDVRGSKRAPGGLP